MPAKKRGLTSAAALKRQERTEEVLALRREAYSYDEIVVIMRAKYPTEKFYKQKIHAWVLKGMKAIIDEPARENLRMDLQRLDVMFKQTFARAKNGDFRAMNTCLNIIDRRARIFGYEDMDPEADVGMDEAAPVEVKIVDKRRKPDTQETSG